MRYSEFRKTLIEYDSLDTARDQIIATISGLSAENEEDAKMLDRIFKIISSEGIGSKIKDAFTATTRDEYFSIDPFLKKITQDIYNVDSDYKSLSAFLDRLESDQVVNLGVFSKAGAGSLSAMFNNDATAVKVFDELKLLGAGKKQKGPGEYALAMMSTKISLRDEEGDLDIDGAGKVEMKAETTSGGGRLGDGGPSNPVAKKYWSALPSIAAHPGKGLGLGNFVRYLAVDLPLNDPEKKKQRESMLTEWYKGIFKNPAPIVKALMQDDPVQAEKDYGRANFEMYKESYGWDTLLVINYPMQKYFVCKTGDDFVRLKDSKQLGSFSISVIPSAARPSEVFAQLSMTKAKV